MLSQLNSLSTKFAKDKAKYEVKRVRLEVLLVADAFMQWSEHKNWSTLARVIEKHKHKSAAIKAAIRLTLPPYAEVKSEKGVIKIAVEGEREDERAEARASATHKRIDAMKDFCALKSGGCK